MSTISLANSTKLLRSLSRSVIPSRNRSARNNFSTNNALLWKELERQRSLFGGVVARNSGCQNQSFRRPFSSTNDDEKATDGDAAKENDASSSDDDKEKEEPLSPEASVEEKLVAQVKELKDQLLRSLAEQENTRRIAKRDVESARNFAVTSFAKSLLDTSDNLSRAMDAVQPPTGDDSVDSAAALKTLYEGIQMTDTGLTKALQKHGLKKFGQLGEVFDPNKHEALFEYPDEKSKPGTVGQIMKVGFELNGRVIRSAEVGIIKK